MSGIKQRIKDFVYSPAAPNWLANWYFSKKDSSDRKRLKQLLQADSDLMDAVPRAQRFHWKSRIQRVLDSSDNQHIAKVANAGKIESGWLVMHNGILVDPLSYYSFPLLKMLMQNCGVHEPQEERIFQEALKTLDCSKPPTMLELGAYWSFYSMWLKSVCPQAKCVMVEPDRKNLLYGKRNFALNNMSGTFVHAGIGSKTIRGSRNVTVEAICKQHKVEFLDILHSDIQGFELEMLHGAKRLFDENRIGYVFVSTHSEELHRDCKAFIDEYNFVEIASVTPNQSSSWDGVLVMRAAHYPGLDAIQVEKIEEGRA